jgi:glycosyltransferase involved in cell wall biosynthesis
MTPVVLHVLPVDAPRGAQTYARALRDALASDRVHHRTLTLFRSGPGALRPDISANVSDGPLRKLGFDPRASLALRRALNTYDPAAVVVHGGEPLKYAVVARVPSSRLVYLKIGAGDAQLAGPRRRLHRFFLRRAGRIVVVSHAAESEAVALGAPRERVVVIPNGRDPERYREALSRGNAAPRLTFVGQLNESKRPLLFVELVRALRAERLPIAASIAGVGPLLEQVRNASRALDIEILGAVNDVPALLARSDVFVFCGAPPEGMPGVLIEAGMSALATVTTAVPGADEVVEDGHTGFVVPIDDFEGLLAATRTLATDNELRATMGAAARRHCIEHFALSAGVAQWNRLLHEILEPTCTSST